MPSAAKILIDQALELPAVERMIVAEQLLMSLDRPDPQIDTTWATEAEARLDAFQDGRIEAISVNEVFGKYDQE
jgi:putative addiction module component (TIGR02574 family)